MGVQIGVAIVNVVNGNEFGDNAAYSSIKRVNQRENGWVNLKFKMYVYK